jgi:signal transduction histidine kinase
LGFAQLVAKVPRLPRQAREDVGRIEAASLRARDVIRQLMAFARQTPPREGRVDVNRLILKSADLWRPRCQAEGVRLEYALDPGLPETLADESQLRQVVTNLVVNAVQAMPEGGTLRIETAPDDGVIRIAVRDTGTGIAPEVLPRIFDPFFTTKDVDQGTGLGLSLVHGIVVGHGGRVEASSEPGHGTCVTVTLPVRTPVEDDGEDGEGRDGED